MDFLGGTVVKNLPANAWVQSLVWEDSTHHEATKPTSRIYRAHVLQILKPMCVEPVLPSKRSHCSEKPVRCNRVAPRSQQLEKAHTKRRRASAAKTKISKLNFKL